MPTAEMKESDTQPLRARVVSLGEQRAYTSWGDTFRVADRYDLYRDVELELDAQASNGGLLNILSLRLIGPNIHDFLDPEENKGYKHSPLTLFAVGAEVTLAGDLMVERPPLPEEGTFSPNVVWRSAGVRIEDTASHPKIAEMIAQDALLVLDISGITYVDKVAAYMNELRAEIDAAQKALEQGIGSISNVTGPVQELAVLQAYVDGTYGNERGVLDRLAVLSTALDDVNRRLEAEMKRLDERMSQPGFTGFTDWDYWKRNTLYAERGPLLCEQKMLSWLLTLQ